MAICPRFCPIYQICRIYFIFRYSGASSRKVLRAFWDIRNWIKSFYFIYLLFIFKVNVIWLYLQFHEFFRSQQFQFQNKRKILNRTKWQIFEQETVMHFSVQNFGRKIFVDFIFFIDWSSLIFFYWLILIDFIFFIDWFSLIWDRRTTNSEGCAS